MPRGLAGGKLPTGSSGWAGARGPPAPSVPEQLAAVPGPPWGCHVPALDLPQLRGQLSEEEKAQAGTRKRPCQYQSAPPGPGKWETLALSPLSSASASTSTSFSSSQPSSSVINAESVKKSTQAMGLPKIK